MKLACQHLAYGTSVQESCFKVGMEDPYHFSRLFKKIMGKAPSYYQSFAQNGELPPVLSSNQKPAEFCK